MEKELPKGWVKTELGKITTKPQYGWTSKANGSGEIKYLRTTDLSKGKVNWNTVPFCIEIPPDVNKYQIEKDDILISRAGSVGLSYRIEEPPPKTVFASYLIRFKPLGVLPKLIEYYLKSPSYWNGISSVSAGIAVQNINATKLAELEFPLPPLTEQNRIVAKLDKLFAQLEVINASLDRIPVLLKNFRQQVLTQAVTGKLTEEWRKGLSMQEWQVKKLKDLGDSRLGKMLDRAKNQGKSVDYLRNINVRWFSIDFSDINKIKIEDKDLPKYEIKINDILVCEGGEPGRAAIWKYDRRNIIYQKALHRIRLKKEILPEYFLYHLKVDASSGNLNQHFTGTTIKHLTGKEFSKYQVFVPPIKEQEEIVRVVEILFSKADSIEEQYNLLKLKIKNLPQAILHKAFKGELVPQLENEGDARELLEEIRGLKKKVGKKEKERLIN